MKKKIMNFADGPKEIYEGMTVVFTNGQSGSHFCLIKGTVDKVGRKLVSVDRYRFYLESGKEKTEYVPGLLYSSLDAYDRCAHESSFINRVTNFVSSRSFKPTLEQAKVLAEMFGIQE